MQNHLVEYLMPILLDITFEIRHTNMSFCCNQMGLFINDFYEGWQEIFYRFFFVTTLISMLLFSAAVAFFVRDFATGLCV